MVLQVRCPRGMTLRRLIESKFKDWGCKTFPNYKKWLTIPQVSELLNIPERRVLNHVANSKRVHGLLFNNDSLLIHPEGVFKRFGINQRRLLNVQLKRDTSKICDSIPETTTDS